MYILYNEEEMRSMVQKTLWQQPRLNILYVHVVYVRGRLLSMVLNRPELLLHQCASIEDVHYCVCWCVCEFAISSNACCLCVRLCVCMSMCLRSSESLPYPPVFVFASRAPLHFAFTEGKPCVKMQLTPFPQQDTQHKRANTGFHFYAFSSITCQTMLQSRKPANTLQWRYDIYSF